MEKNVTVLSKQVKVLSQLSCILLDSQSTPPPVMPGIIQADPIDQLIN